MAILPPQECYTQDKLRLSFMQVAFAHLIGQEQSLENKEAGTPGDSSGNR